MVCAQSLHNLIHILYVIVNSESSLIIYCIFYDCIPVITTYRHPSHFFLYNKNHRKPAVICHEDIYVPTLVIFVKIVSK